MDHALQGDSPMTPSHPRDQLADLFYRKDLFSRDLPRFDDDSHFFQGGAHSPSKPNGGPHKTLDAGARMASFQENMFNLSNGVSPALVKHHSAMSAAQSQMMGAGIAI